MICEDKLKAFRRSNVRRSFAELENNCFVHSALFTSTKGLSAVHVWINQ